MEEEIFKKSIIEKDKLVEYGFIKNNNTYTYTKDIMNNSFQLIVTITNNKVKVKTIDKELNEEYLNFKIKNHIGEFVNKVREEIINILVDIRNKCTITNTFIYKQANRISTYIKDKYEVNPEFLWEDDKNAVFRNNNNKKWFGIIMYINKNKLDKENKMIEVMNVKLPPEQIEKLVLKKGYYKAYHMNKKYWISFILDDTIKDKKLHELIDTSYNYTINKRR